MEGQDYGFDLEDEFDILGDTPVDPKASKIDGNPIDDTGIQDTDIDILSDTPEVKVPDAAKPEPNTPEVPEAPEAPEEPDDEPGDGEDDETFQAIAENLVEMGIFTLNEGEEKIDLKNPKAFAERWQNENQKGAVNMINQIVGQYGEEYADAFDKIFNKGLNPYEYFTRQAQIEGFEAINLEDNEEVQKQIYRTYLRTLHPELPAEKIESKLQKVIDFEALAEEATDAKAYLVKQEKDALEARTKAEEQQRYNEYMRQEKFGESVHQILSSKLKDGDFDGIPVTPKVAESAFDFLYTKKKYQDGFIGTEAERFVLDLQHPDNHALATKFALMARSGFDTSKIQKKAVSKESNELFRNLKRKQANEARTPLPPSSNHQEVWGLG